MAPGRREAPTPAALRSGPAAAHQWTNAIPNIADELINTRRNPR